MKRYKKVLLNWTIPALFFCFFQNNLYAELSLSDYLSNDLELKRLSLELKKEALSSKSTSIENGFSIKLSTGTAKFTFSSDDSYIKFEPNAAISIPQAANLTFSASTNVEITGESSDSSLENMKFSLSADLLSGSTLSRKISIMKAERKLLEAKRNLENYAITAENNYYKNLRSLFETSSSIISAQKDMYDDSISFDEIKAKGYATTSSKYRQAEMKVLSDKHTVETKIHDLEHDLAVFASKCNTTYSTEQNPKDFLPSEIHLVQPLNILDYDKEMYTKIESARWKQKIAELERKADKDLELSANAGYTLKNSSVSDSSSDTLDFGLNLSYAGVTLGAGTEIPVNGNSPVYTLSASLNPNSFRTLSIKKQTNNLNIEEENITIQSAENSYSDDVVDKQTELIDIKWTNKTHKETYDMYENLEKDMAKYLEAGVITESEYLNSFANKELYRIKILINDIDLIIYNNELKLLFCRDK